MITIDYFDAKKELILNNGKHVLIERATQAEARVAELQLQAALYITILERCFELIRHAEETRNPSILEGIETYASGLRDKSQITAWGRDLKLTNDADEQWLRVALRALKQIRSLASQFDVVNNPENALLQRKILDLVNDARAQCLGSSVDIDSPDSNL